MQCRQGDVLAIDFEETPQGVASVTATKAVCTECNERLRNITADELRIGHNVVSGGDDRKRLAQALLEELDALCCARGPNRYLSV